MAAKNTKSKKRKRGPYLSYLTNPLVEEVPRSTLKTWSTEGLSQVQQEANVECDDYQEMGATEDTNTGRLEPETVGDPTAGDADEYTLYDEHDDELVYADDFEMVEEMWEDEPEPLDECCIDEANDEKTQQSDDPKAKEAEENLPLYAGAKITFGISMLLIITFAMRHQLSGTALADLLTLIDLHLIAPNCFSRSMATIHKFFKQLKNPIQYHYYCSRCYEYIGIHKSTCCSNKHCLQDFSNKGSLSYFIIIPLEPQLEALFARPDMKDLIHHRQTRKKKNALNIEDVLDGRLYKAHFDDDGYFKDTKECKKKNELHISLQINTDGVALFRSSMFSVWPVYYIINELPPNCRFHRKNRLFGGLWFGMKKPHFHTFMQPFALSLRDLFHRGTPINCYSSGDDINVRCLLLCGSFDAPAKCLFQSFVQFNGNYGCPYCLMPGTTVKTSERGHTHAYPFNRENLQTGHSQVRTHDQTREFAKIATDRVIATGVAKPEKGVRGLSWFLHVPGFDIIRGIGIDYMHGTLLGVVKMLLNLWLDKQHHEDAWYIGKWAKEVEKRYVNIKPPSSISRLPRSLIGNLSHLKASELRSFLLFYSLPCLYGFLPPIYFQHYLLLVEAIYILLQDSISMSCLSKASKLLKHFCIRIGELYGNRYETYNIHGLLHLVDRVQDLGPLWTHSCFCFEDFNGELRHLFHGTQGVELQIVLSVCIQQKIPELVPLLPQNSSAFEFFEALTSKGKLSHRKECISGNIFVIGAILKHHLIIQHKQLIENDIGEVCAVYKFKRISIDGRIVHCKEYKPGMRRNNYTIEYQLPATLQLGHGQILYFVKCYVKCPNPVFCAERCPCKIAAYRAIVQCLVRDPLTVLSSDTITRASVPHIVPVSASANEIVVIPLEMIGKTCVHVDCGINGISFVASFPNIFEKD